MDEYQRLLNAIRNGHRPNLAEFLRATITVGKSPSDVLADLCDPAGPWKATWNGDPCSVCGGRIVVRNTRRSGEWWVKQLVCRDCGRRAPDLVLLRDNQEPGKGLAESGIMRETVAMDAADD